MAFTDNVFGKRRLSQSAMERALTNRSYSYTPKNVKRSERKSAHCDCRAVLPSGEYITAWLVDISQTGARIRMAKHLRLPEFFHLKVPDYAVDRKVRRVWQGVYEAGLAFS